MVIFNTYFYYLARGDTNVQRATLSWDAKQRDTINLQGSDTCIIKQAKEERNTTNGECVSDVYEIITRTIKRVEGQGWGEGPRENSGMRS